MLLPCPVPVDDQVHGGQQAGWFGTFFTLGIEETRLNVNRNVTHQLQTYGPTAFGVSSCVFCACYSRRPIGSFSIATSFISSCSRTISTHQASVKDGTGVHSVLALVLVWMEEGHWLGHTRSQHGVV